MPKSNLKNRFLPLAVSLLVIVILILGGPAYAFTSSIVVDQANPKPGEKVTFTVDMTKATVEVINTTELKVKDPNGNTQNATKINCSPDYAGNSNAYGYGYTYGYGYANPGQGHGYGYGYNNSNANAINCTFEFTPTIAGSYSAQVYVNSKAIGPESQGIITAKEGSVSNPVQGTTYAPTDDTKLKFTALPAGNYNVNITESSTTPSGTNTTGFSIAGEFFEITSNLANGTFSVELTFAYPDADNDGIVDGTSINENNLNVYYWNGSTWAIVSNPIRDTATNTITVTVDHFTWFALMQANAATTPTGGTGGTTTTTTQNSTSSGSSTTTCTPNWNCSAWTDCTTNNTQTRSCIDLQNCGMTAGKPTETQSCNYVMPVRPVEPIVPETGQPAIVTETTQPSGPVTGFFGLAAGAGNAVAGIVAIALIVLGAVSFNYFRKKQLKK